MWLNFKTYFHFRPATPHINLFHSPLFFNPYLKVLDLLYEDNFKPPNVLKDNLVLENLNYLSYHRLKQPLYDFKERNQNLVLNSKGVKVLSD